MSLPNDMMFFINESTFFPTNANDVDFAIKKWREDYKKGMETVLFFEQMNVFAYSPSYYLIPLLIAQSTKENFESLRIQYWNFNKTVLNSFVTTGVVLCVDSWYASEFCRDIVNTANEKNMKCLLLDQFMKGIEEPIVKI